MKIVKYPDTGSMLHIFRGGALESDGVSQVLQSLYMASVLLERSRIVRKSMLSHNLTLTT